MDKVQHPSNNKVLGAPAGWDQSDVPCSALAVTEIAWGDGPAIVSFWKPTAQELADLNAGAYVALWVSGQGMPPVALSVEQ